MNGRRIPPATTALAPLAVALLVMMAAGAARAQTAPPPRDDGHVGLAFGARIGGAMFGAAVDLDVVLPQLWFDVQTDAVPPPPPPPPAPPPPPCCYQPPPPSAIATEPAPPQQQRSQLGLAFSGLVQSPSQAGRSPTAGVAASLQARTSATSLLALELQSLGTDRPSDQSHRNDLAGLLAGRLYLWDAALAPYLELAGGLGRAAVDTTGGRVTAAQLVGRAGFGLELRLGDHLVLEGLLALVERVRIDGSSATAAAPSTGPTTVISDRETSTELRGGLAYRF